VKQWIEDRLETLSRCVAVSVRGFPVMDDHLRVLVRLDADDAKSSSAQEVVRRRITAYPPKTAKGEEFAISSKPLTVNDLRKKCIASRSLTTSATARDCRVLRDEFPDALGWSVPT
jgi:hypothetical protein